MAKEVKGIGGWLLIPTFIFIINALVFLYYSFTFLVVGEVMGLIFYGAITFLYVYALILEFGYKKEFPNFAIITLWGSMILLYAFIFLFGLFEIVETEIAELIGWLIGNFIWTAYFLKSKRVKNTFGKKKIKKK